MLVLGAVAGLVKVEAGEHEARPPRVSSDSARSLDVLAGGLGLPRDHHETEAIDVMHHIWSGDWPDNRSPRLVSMSLDDKAAAQSVKLRSGESYTATVDVSDYENDPLVYRWELKEESRATQKGGDFEESIPNLAGLIENPTAPSTTIRAPAAGAYRLFAYAYDDHGHAAHANIPFLVSDSGAE